MFGIRIQFVLILLFIIPSSPFISLGLQYSINHEIIGKSFNYSLGQKFDFINFKFKSDNKYYFNLSRINLDQILKYNFRDDSELFVIDNSQSWETIISRRQNRFNWFYVKNSQIDTIPIVRLKYSFKMVEIDSNKFPTTMKQRLLIISTNISR